MNDATEFRAVTYRLHPGTRARHLKLVQIVGACRYVWNHFLARNRRDYATYKLRKALFDAGLVFNKPSPPSVSFHSMGIPIRQRLGRASGQARRAESGTEPGNPEYGLVATATDA